MKDAKATIENPPGALRYGDKETRRLAARLLGSRTSPKKAASSRRNGLLGGAYGREGAAAGIRGGRPLSPLTAIRCTCGAGLRPSHLAKCPRGRAIRRREANGRPVVW